MWRMVQEWPELILERLEDSGVARVLLNRPERRNALNDKLVDAFFEALEIIRPDTDIKVVITKGSGPVFCSGLDLYYLRTVSRSLRDWDRPSVTSRLMMALRDFPRIMIAQVHGYVLGGGLALMNMHDLVFAADNVQMGMPEVLRGSFGQMATSTLFHAGIPIKKAALIQLLGRNITGAEADRLGLVSLSVPEDELENTTNDLARELASRHLGTLQHAKIAAQMGRDLSLTDAIHVDWLVGARQSIALDPTEHVEEYLRSQKGGANTRYKRPDA
ncbi:MAG TPA: enoyl-CoA hydratase/isomerase family protein [Chloroflexota bacterium]|nr:enoyl-CoA hydratase/isomerase family protein [Chloroflexota bacterium]